MPPLCSAGGDLAGRTDACRRPFNFSGNPTLSVPAGVSNDGLPHGIQLVGPLLSEAILCQVGHAYEQATKWHRRRPLVG